MFCDVIEPNGVLVVSNEDEAVKQLGENYAHKLSVKPYHTPEYRVVDEGTILTHQSKEYALHIFGAHNLQNLMGAMLLGESMHISNHDFLTAIQSFKGAGKRLQKVIETKNFVLFKDFAHSPSKLKATTRAVKEQFPNRTVIACMELHTFSSLRKDFLPLYQSTMDAADEALVYFSPEVVKHKKLDPITTNQVKDAFGGNVTVVNETKDVLKFIRSKEWNNAVLLMMSSGNFDGIDYDKLGKEIVGE